MSDCPFCGEAESRGRFDHVVRRWRCGGCGATGPHAATRAGSIKLWRTRPGEAELSLRLENAKSELDVR